MNRLPTWLRAAINTSWQTFLGAFALLLLAALGDAQDWLDTGAAVDVAFYGKALLSLVIAFVAGVITAVFRRVRPAEQAYIDTTAVDVTDRQLPAGITLDEVSIGLRQDLQAYIDDYGWGGVKNALELLRPATPVIPPKEH